MLGPAAGGRFPLRRPRGLALPLGLIGSTQHALLWLAFLRRLLHGPLLLGRRLPHRPLLLWLLPHRPLLLQGPLLLGLLLLRGLLLLGRLLDSRLPGKLCPSRFLLDGHSLARWRRHRWRGRRVCAPAAETTGRGIHRTNEGARRRCLLRPEPFHGRRIQRTPWIARQFLLPLAEGHRGRRRRCPHNDALVSD